MDMRSAVEMNALDDEVVVYLQNEGEGGSVWSLLEREVREVRFELSGFVRGLWSDPRIFLPCPLPNPILSSSVLSFPTKFSTTGQNPAGCVYPRIYRQ